jgi:hypothetical protein
MWWRIIRIRYQNAAFNMHRFAFEKPHEQPGAELLTPNLVSYGLYSLPALYLRHFTGWE